MLTAFRESAMRDNPAEPPKPSAEETLPTEICDLLARN